MNNNWFTYIKVNEECNKVKTSGIKFEEFISGIDEKPDNILILEGDSLNSERNFDLSLDYIKGDNLEVFYREDVYSFGDFSWIDFQKEENLDCIDKHELSEILYFKHMKTPFNTFLFNSLNNKYAYFAHDDDYIAQIYMKKPKNYKGIINYKIQIELKGRKKYIENIPAEILEYIYDLSKEGIIIDFENSYCTGVNIYTVGDVELIDDAHHKLDRYRKSSKGINLDYDTKKKSWNIY